MDDYITSLTDVTIYTIDWYETTTSSRSPSSSDDDDDVIEMVDEHHGPEYLEACIEKSIQFCLANLTQLFRSSNSSSKSIEESLKYIVGSCMYFKTLKNAYTSEIDEKLHTILDMVLSSDQRTSYEHIKRSKKIFDQLSMYIQDCLDHVR
eukprot:CAMPEP_0117422360 /NCGR_PEP_ID=MMETSP0758-20121206/3218_1 /TAXON_ID=63605 /ORGANISM="Percolomonas cosmopolitus, Strain AE-1 (ATCC 50343)" /LENGTH=149 /DNA_ID=CAMNT_0005204939 /DNA_START=823 /DNA_END=1268 /DNA_ORIENTATION=+